MMQSNTLAQMERLLKEKKFNINVEKFIEFIKISKNNWIYPDALQRYIKCDIVDMYIALEYLVDNNVLENYIEVYCPKCYRYIGYYYKTLFEVPDDIGCPHCDKEIENKDHNNTTTNNTIVVYKAV